MFYRFLSRYFQFVLAFWCFSRSLVVRNSFEMEQCIINRLLITPAFLFTIYGFFKLEFSEILSLLKTLTYTIKQAWESGKTSEKPGNRQTSDFVKVSFPDNTNGRDLEINRTWPEILPGFDKLIELSQPLWKGSPFVEELDPTIVKDHSNEFQSMLEQKLYAELMAIIYCVQR